MRWSAVRKFSASSSFLIASYDPAATSPTSFAAAAVSTPSAVAASGAIKAARPIAEASRPVLRARDATMPAASDRLTPM